MDAHVASGTSPDSPQTDPTTTRAQLIREQIAAERAERLERQRAGYIAGLRELATLLEQHPEVPVPYDGTEQSPLTIHHLGFTDEHRDAFAATVRALPGKRDKRSWGEDVGGAYLDVGTVLGGGLHVKATAYRETVCERVVVGTREVELPAEPERVIPAREATTQVIEDVEWRCAPVLG